MENTIPLKIKLNIWRYNENPNQVIILYDKQEPFQFSSSLMQNWKIFFSFYAFNPLVVPYPENTQLFRAIHSSSYPNELKTVEPVLDMYHISNNGTFFVAYVSPLEGTTKLPFRNTNIFVEKI